MQYKRQVSATACLWGSRLWPRGVTCPPPPSRPSKANKHQVRIARNLTTQTIHYNLLRSLPGAWEAAPRCRLTGRIQTCAWVAAPVLSKSHSIGILSALYTITLFPLPVSSGYRQFSHCCVGIIFQTAAYGESLFLFRDVNHDSVTKALVCLWLCDCAIFAVCVFVCFQPILVDFDAQRIAGSQGEGGDAFVAVGPHVVVVHLIHPHSRLVQDTCRTGYKRGGHVTELDNTSQMGARSPAR